MTKAKQLIGVFLIFSIIIGKVIIQAPQGVLLFKFLTDLFYYYFSGVRYSVSIFRKNGMLVSSKNTLFIFNS